MSTIEIKNLTKRYGEAEVLSNINMKLESGKIYGLVGRNGSGKTMLMSLVILKDEIITWTHWKANC